VWLLLELFDLLQPAYRLHLRFVIIIEIIIIIIIIILLEIRP